MGARETIQARIDAQQVYDAIEFGRRADRWLRRDIDINGRALGYMAYARKRDVRMGTNFAGAADEMADTAWAHAQWDAAWVAAAGFDLDIGEEAGFGSAWNLKRAKKMAAEELAAAKAAEKAIGTKRQLRLALAA